MTTLEGRPNTALLVIDVQTGVVAGAHERDTVVANVASLVDKARREQVPVVWVQDDGPGKGSDDWQIVREMIATHVAFTGSAHAAMILDTLAEQPFVKVMPRDYKRVLSAEAKARSESREPDFAELVGAAAG